MSPNHAANSDKTRPPNLKRMESPRSMHVGASVRDLTYKKHSPAGTEPEIQDRTTAHLFPLCGSFQEVAARAR